MIACFALPFDTTSSVTFVPGLWRAIRAGQIVRRLDGHALDRHDDIAGLDPRLRGRTAGLDFVDQRAGRLRETERGRQRRVHGLNHDAELAAPDGAGREELGNDLLHGVDRDREADAPALRGDDGVDPIT